MSDYSRRQSVIFILDLIAALAVFYLCRYSGGYPRWYWLIVSGLLWTVMGVLSHKLQFQNFHRVPSAVFSILVIDLLTYAIIILIWRFAFPQRCGIALQWHPLVLLSLIEVVIYLVFRKLVMRKIPYFFEDNILDEKCEPSVSYGVRVDENPSVLPSEFMKFYESTTGLGWNEMEQWWNRHRDEFSKTLVFDSAEPSDIMAAEIKDPEMVFVNPRFNDIRHLNTLMEFANYKLADSGCIVLHGQTSGARREHIYERNPSGINRIIFFLDYIWSRVMPKLRVTRWLYMGLTDGQNRNFPRVEILGRLCRSGFTIAGEDIRDGVYLVVAVKTSRPVTSDEPNFGPVIRLKRIGYQGQTIGVLKLRTMYAYSEYLQKYTFDRLGLARGGKIQSDFRVNIWGKMLRSVWIDEIPMIYNWIAGDLKLVGVRPLSAQYFSLYSPEMQQMRITVKPGLIPPFYYEEHAPETIDEVQESEKRYIEAYRQAPFRTDFRYFWGAMRNILFRHHRSR